MSYKVEERHLHQSIYNIKTNAKMTEQQHVNILADISSLFPPRTSIQGGVDIPHDARKTSEKEMIRPH